MIICIPPHKEIRIVLLNFNEPREHRHTLKTLGKQCMNKMRISTNNRSIQKNSDCIEDYNKEFQQYSKQKKA